MSEYKVGQRVRIEWPDGTLIEGVLREAEASLSPSLVIPRGGSQVLMWQADFGIEGTSRDGRVVTILSEPEPTGLGAVVRATVNGHRIVCNRDHNGVWWPHRDMGLGEWRTPPWSAMGDPEILFEGWSE